MQTAEEPVYKPYLLVGDTEVMHQLDCEFSVFFLPKRNDIQLSRLDSSKCRTFGIELFQYEADWKTRRYFGVDIHKTLVGVLIFG